VIHSLFQGFFKLSYRKLTARKTVTVNASVEVRRGDQLS
jgi:hypothetical protein